MEAVIERTTTLSTATANTADEKFDVLCRATFNAVLVHDAGMIVNANERCALLFGCEIADLIGRSILDFTAPEMRAGLQARTITAAERPFDIVALKKNGLRFPAELCEVAVGTTTMRVVAIRDLGERRSKSGLRRRRDRVLNRVAFDGICVQKDGKLTEVNRSFERLTGYTTEQLIGMDVGLLIPVEERAGALERIRTRDSRMYESSMLRSDGTSIPVEVCATSISGGERVTAIRDISKRRDAETALRASEDGFRDLVEHCHDLIGSHDLDGTILSANAAVGCALNRPSGELLGQNINEHFPEADRPRFADYREVLLREGVASGTVRVTTAEGGTRLWEYRSTLRTEGVARPVARVLARDVTESDESLTTARLSEEHFRSIIENSPDLIAIVELDGTLRYHNPAVDRVLGIAGSVVGRIFQDLVHPDDEAKATEFLSGQIGDSEFNRVIELRLRHQNGTYRSFEVIARSLTEAGRVTGILTNARDITDRKLLETQLAQANRISSLGRLAATVAHEFNNVLMGIQPFMELMQRPNASAEVLSKTAWHISNSIQRGKRITLDILRFTQPAHPVTTQVDLGEWWETFAPEAETLVGNVVRVVSSIEERGTCIIADKEQLGQVMANLVANARDAMPAGGILSVDASRPPPDSVFEFGYVANPERFIHITVADTGSGIAPDVIQQIFEPLFTTKKSGGTGLGLAVAHQVLAQHGGYIFAESEIGRGSAFHLFLPAGVPPCDEACETRDASTLPALHTLLMVEDEQAIVDGISALLECEGMKVVAVGTGGAAVAAVAEFHPDVVLLDFGLPDMDGSEVYARLRKVNPTLPVIFATGHGDRVAIHDGMGDKRTRFLQKPFEIASLLEMIAELS